ncbi:hypothetical protein [Leifsonia sp. NPDC058230]
MSSHDWPLGGAVAHEAHTRSGDDIIMQTAWQPAATPYAVAFDTLRL